MFMSARIIDMSPGVRFRSVFTDLRLLQDQSVLTRTPHREKVEVSLKNASNGGVFYIRRRVDFASETRLHEWDFPDGGGLEKIVGHPGLRVEELHSRRIAGVLKRLQHLREKRKYREIVANIRHVHQSTFASVHVPRQGAVWLAVD